MVPNNMPSRALDRASTRAAVSQEIAGEPPRKGCILILPFDENAGLIWVRLTSERRRDAMNACKSVCLRVVERETEFAR